jgi:hypothetical protein
MNDVVSMVSGEDVERTLLEKFLAIAEPHGWNQPPRLFFVYKDEMLGGESLGDGMTTLPLGVMFRLSEFSDVRERYLMDEHIEHTLASLANVFEEHIGEYLALSPKELEGYLLLVEHWSVDVSGQDEFREGEIATTSLREYPGAREGRSAMLVTRNGFSMLTQHRGASHLVFRRDGDGQEQASGSIIESLKKMGSLTLL